MLVARNQGNVIMWIYADTQNYNVSADYILLGREKDVVIPAPMPEKKKMSKEMRKAIGIIAIIAATAAVTVLFIIALGLVSEFLLWFYTDLEKRVEIC